MNLKSPKENPGSRLKANFDYERCLLNNQEPSIQMVKQWDWLALWLEGVSYNLDWYAESYLNLIKQYRSIFQSNTNSEPENWWGELKNIELEKKLNSKLLALQCKNELNINHLKETKFEVNKKYSGKHFLRENLNFAGKGNQIFDTRPINIKDSKTYLVAPYVERNLDFSTWSDGREWYLYQNHVSEHGQYLGSQIRSDFLNPLQLKKLEEIDQAIRSWYKNNGAISGFGIDYFLFDNKLIFSEVNYRKTMGLMACRLKKIFKIDKNSFSFGLESLNRKGGVLVSSKYCPLKWYVWDK